MISRSKKQHELGQFLTPTHVADLMASMLQIRSQEVELLDAGAGTGALTHALVRRLCKQKNLPLKISATVFELDSRLINSLEATLKNCREDCTRVGIDFSAQVFNEDFIFWAVSALRRELFSNDTPLFNAAIVNPPYRKLRSDSKARQLLRSIGVETTNFYSAFVLLILKLLSNGGEFVAITPRSFCNGPYFRPFRRELLETSALHHLHLFESRAAAFARDGVLQENLIIHALKGEPKPLKVLISTSNGKENSPTITRKIAYSDVVLPNDLEQFIRISNDARQIKLAVAARTFQKSLDDLGLSVSTGRVVDFRAKIFLRERPGANTAPLIYPAHLDRGFVNWPGMKVRKPNAIVIHEKTRELLVPEGFYVLVKRFSSKEETKRIVASVYDHERISARLIGFENHLNYFHIQGRGMPLGLAKGLAVFLNSTLLDRYFRQFSGHTQVNAADLRNITYPSYEQLLTIGRAVGNEFPDQEQIDALIDLLVVPSTKEATQNRKVLCAVL